MKENKTQIETTFKELQCQRCNNIWSYKGNNPYFATCSYCRSTVSIKKNKIQVDSLVSASNHPADSIRREVTDR